MTIFFFFPCSSFHSKFINNDNHTQFLHVGTSDKFSIDFFFLFNLPNDAVKVTLLLTHVIGKETET